MVIAPVQVKICCIHSPDEARMALSFGAAALGLVSEMPAGPSNLSDEAIRDIVESVPSSVGTFLLTAVTDADRLVEKALACGVNTIQLWDPLAPGDYQRLRAALPGVSLVQAIHVMGRSAVMQAIEAAPQADALVLDSSNPQVPYRWESQAGRTHDWEISREIAETVDCPVLLAGGLNAGNLEFAIRTVRPYGVDVCSGVRTDDALDRRKLVSFFEALRKIPA
ncbi:MAG: phosphoribosylanthranilate isomerase [Candidatus Palauibacterales bacterium]|nr:phosphoribosylanthranilate isomerase [Candidatus Palauibacterales bacterium]MDP2482985.1 phosphoribosylanthranilate isomerase [Candidatus Palauibacterales bacterium]